jgi:hypothetical protein
MADVIPSIVLDTKEEVIAEEVVTEEVVAEEVVAEEVAAPADSQPVVDEFDILADDSDESEEEDEEPVQSFHYIYKQEDYSKYILDFVKNEPSYGKIIRSYVTNSLTTTLYVKDTDGSILSIGELISDPTGDHVLVEMKRTSGPSPYGMIYTSIQRWAESVIGHEKFSITALFDQVFIGENNVNLWRVLSDAKEAELVEQSEIEALHKKNIEMDTEVFNNHVILIILVFILAYVIPVLMLTAI